MTTMTMMTTGAAGGIRLRATGITVDLGGAPAGPPATLTVASDNGTCLLQRWGLPGRWLRVLRAFRDWCLEASLWRYLVRWYYALAG